MFRIHSRPSLRAPFLLAAFGGWPDAASAATGAIEYLIMKWGPERIADADPSELFVQSVHRPEIRVSRTGDRRLRWPRLTMYAVTLPGADRDALLLLGPEPDLRWRALSMEVVDLAASFQADTIVCLGGYLAPVPHRGPVYHTGRASAPELAARLQALGLQDGNYQGPTGFPTALLDAAMRRDIATASIWAASPVYLRGLVNPKLSASLLRVVESMLRIDLAIGQLDVAGRDLELRIDRELSSRPDLQQFVSKLGEDDAPSPTATEPLSDTPDEPLPPAAELLEGLEQYLRRMRGDQ
jgi:proteasome assembly chaperone (PAC2) family protein